MKTIRKIAIHALAIGFAALAVNAVAQTYPAKQIRWVVSYPPGGGTDFLARTVGNQIAKQVFNSPRSLAITAGIIGALGLIPGMPNLVFITIASALGYAAWWMKERERKLKASRERERARENENRREELRERWRRSQSTQIAFSDGKPMRLSSSKAAKRDEGERSKNGAGDGVVGLG